MHLRKSLFITIVAVLLGGTSLAVATSTRNNINNLFKANVEALADGEDSPDDPEYSCTVTTLCGNSTLYWGSVSCTGKECARGFLSVTCDGHTISC